MNSPIDDRLRERIDALLDGALTETQAAELQARIDADAALHAEYVRRRRTVELVRALPPASAPDGFAGSILERLPERPVAAPAALPSIGQGRVRSLWLWGSGLAAAAAVVLAVSIDGWDSEPSDDWTLASEQPAELDGEIAGRESGFSEMRESRPAFKDTAKKVEGKSDGAGGDRRALRDLDESESLGPTMEMEAQADKGAAEEKPLTGQPVPTGLGRAEADGVGARDRSVKRGAPDSLLLRVEQTRTVLTDDERKQYLDRVTRANAWARTRRRALRA